MPDDHPFVIRARRAAAIQEICCIIVAGIICAIGAIGCPPKPPVPPDGGDAGAGTCEGVCQHLRALSCPGGEPTHEGATCEDVCQNIQDSGVIRWDLACRVHAPSCAAADACDVDAQN